MLVICLQVIDFHDILCLQALLSIFMDSIFTGPGSCSFGPGGGLSKMPPPELGPGPDRQYTNACEDNDEREK